MFSGMKGFEAQLSLLQHIIEQDLSKFPSHTSVLKSSTSSAYWQSLKEKFFDIIQHLQNKFSSRVRYYKQTNKM
jgi:hypothetical protein